MTQNPFYRKIVALSQIPIITDLVKKVREDWIDIEKLCIMK